MSSYLAKSYDDALREIERLRGLLLRADMALYVNASPSNATVAALRDDIRAALGTQADQPPAAMSAEEHCRMFCAWKGGSPCLADDCPRKAASQPTYGGVPFCDLSASDKEKVNLGIIDADQPEPVVDRPWQEIVKDATRYMWLRREHERDRNLFPLAAVVWKGAGRESATWVNMVDADALDRKIDEQIASDKPSAD